MKELHKKSRITRQKEKEVNLLISYPLYNPFQIENSILLNETKRLRNILRNFMGKNEQKYMK